MSTWAWHKDWRLFWALLFVGLAIYYVPEFFRDGGDLVNEMAGPASETIGEAYDDVVGNEPVSHGREHIAQVMVTFDVNRDYHNWGQLLASYHQLPEIAGRVYAARMVDGEERTTLPDAGLGSQLRLNWHSSARMRWTGIRARVGERSTHLCVDLHEASEGHNILGGVQDILHWVHWDDWHLSGGDVPVAGSCVELMPSGYPHDATRVAIYRPGEDEPTGWLTIRFAGIQDEDLPPRGRGGFAGGSWY